MKWDAAAEQEKVPPEKLMVFTATDWPVDGEGLTEKEKKEAQFDRWCRARHEWQDQYGWPGGFLKRIRQEYRDRHILHFGRLPAQWEAQGITE